ncbi:p53 inducible protein [Achlya hypogyna]|uniref:p53 inducible protein n=1 Tax=Achlya hypogyna TaxID=1202772 RepID=A0A1V9ZEM7_ACHHY|nr:p53 inducible protein [Achlya hypogyna]
MTGNQEVVLRVAGGNEDAAFVAALSPSFEEELVLTAQLERAAAKGERIFEELYTFRSCARALPAVSDPAAHAQVFRVLRPQMRQLKVLSDFCYETTVLLSSNVQKLTTQDACTRVVPDVLLAAFILVLDVLLKLNHLADIKAGLRNDFSVYKRACQHVRDDAAAAEVQVLQEFLGSTTHPKGFIFNSLRHNLHNVKRHVLAAPQPHTSFEGVLCLLLKHALRRLEKKLCLVEDKFSYLRVLPYVLLVLDKDGQGRANTFKGSKAKLDAVGKLLRRYPVVPLFADLTLAPAALLGDSSFASLLPPSDALPAAYDLGTVQGEVRAAGDACLRRLAQCLHAVRLLAQLPHDESPEATYDAVVDGVRLAAQCKGALLLVVGWKHRHPASNEALAAAGADLKSPAVEYERVTKYNFSAAERSALVDVLRGLKSVIAALAGIHARAATPLRHAAYGRVQRFVQHTLLPIMHRTDKKKKQAATKLLRELRALVGDWVVVDTDDYKRTRSARVFGELRARAVGPGPTQLRQLCTLVQALGDKRGGLSGGWGFAGQPDADVAALDAFYADAFFFDKVLALDVTLAALGDTGGLWLREFYLELTKCVQFPVELSVPWMLLEHDLATTGGVALEALLDVYNDAAGMALRQLRRQVLFDEVEAEATLCFDQLVFLLGDELYARAKRGDDAAATSRYFSLVAVSIEHPQILGRRIDVNALVGDHLSAALAKDLDTSLLRLEAGDLTLLAELEEHVTAVRRTHRRLARYFTLDELDDLEAEVLGPRLAAFVQQQLLDQVLPHYLLDWPTATFHRPRDTGAASPRSSRGVFGSTTLSERHVTAVRAHLASLCRLLSASDVGLLVRTVVADLEVKIRDVLPLCVHALGAAVPPYTLPKFLYKMEGCFMYFEGKCKPVLDDIDLKSHIVQCFRHVGNSLGLVALLDEMLATTQVLTGKNVAAFGQPSGQVPALLPFALAATTSALASSQLTATGGFCHAWSALEFITCYDGDGSDGVALAGGTFVHLLRLRQRYELINCTGHVLSVDKEAPPRQADAVGSADEATGRKARVFVAAATRTKLVLAAWVARIEEAPEWAG